MWGLAFSGWMRGVGVFAWEFSSFGFGFWTHTFGKKSLDFENRNDILMDMRLELVLLLGVGARWGRIKMS